MHVSCTTRTKMFLQNLPCHEVVSLTQANRKEEVCQRKVELKRCSLAAFASCYIRLITSTAVGVISMSYPCRR